MPGWAYCAVAAALIAAMAVVARAYLRRHIERRIAENQYDMLVKYREEIENMYREMRGWRHDYHNHIQAMQAYRALNQNERLDAYLKHLNDDLHNVDNTIKSGNVMVDAILGSKISLARHKKIAVNVKATVPAKLTVADVDLCVILGNLLDNAMEACVKIEEESARQIRVYVDVKREQLYISVTNTAMGRPVKRGARYVSEKVGYHGLGIMRTENIVDKYGGYIKSRDEDGAFSTEILLPV